MGPIHKNLAARGWQKLSLAEQLANIGSEVFRVDHWAKLGDQANRNKAFWRALELIDLTIADPRWLFRLAEITRLREILCDLYQGQNQYQSSSQKLKDYFINFALLARKSR